MTQRLFGLALLVGILSCSSGEHLATAERGVAQFRELMQARQFSAIYANGSDELHKFAGEPEMTKILAALNTKLGNVKTAERAGWNVNFHTSGTLVTLGYKTEFEKGSGTEQFVFRVADGKALLISYNVNSPALLLN